MNTVKKGDEFEYRIYDIINRLLLQDELPINSKRSKVYSKKGYPSKDRDGKDVIFDISIETFLPNSMTYSSLWLIECKDYKTPISVDRIEAFHSKILQVGGHKGIFVCSSRFQESAISFGQSHKIGLAIVNSDELLDWKVNRADNSPIIGECDNLIYEWFKTNPKQIGSPFVILMDAKMHFGLRDLLVGHDIKVKQRQLLYVPYISNENLEKKANSLREQFMKSKIIFNRANLVEFIREQYRIKVYSYAELAYKEIGKFLIHHKSIYISQFLGEESPRWMFTLVHEFAHFLLHYNILIENGMQGIVDNESVENLINDVSTIDRMEIQANILTSYFLVPELELKRCLLNVKNELRLYKNIIFIDNQPVNKLLEFQLLEKLSENLGVSKQMIKYRLIRSKLITYETNLL